ncbi:hypothetical protein ACH5RR_018969 [Cinchona calisaya]|uniref:Uncharacterized protein n=1 Tax=Cinchona calisaya TaxID=153742 RepID=A0ABD2ZMZ9_9GENT
MLEMRRDASTPYVDHVSGSSSGMLVNPRSEVMQKFGAHLAILKMLLIFSYMSKLEPSCFPVNHREFHHHVLQKVMKFTLNKEYFAFQAFHQGLIQQLANRHYSQR